MVEAIACFNPIQRLRGGVALVIELALGKSCQLVQVIGKPGGLLRQVNKAILDRAGDRMQPHFLVYFRLTSGDAVQALANEFLDQCGAGAFVFDQNCLRVESPCLLQNRALQLGVFHPPPKDIQQIEILALLSPSRTDTVIAQLRGFYRRIPALKNKIKSCRLLAVLVDFDSFFYNPSSTERSWLLL